MFEPNLDLKSHTHEKKTKVFCGKRSCGALWGFYLTISNLRHFIAFGYSQWKKDSGWEVSGGSMPGMWFYAGSQHTASLAFCNWSVLSESCSPAQLSGPDRGWTGCLWVCVCVCVCVRCLIPLSWILPISNSDVCVFLLKRGQRSDKFKLHIQNDTAIDHLSSLPDGNSNFQLNAVAFIKK